MQGLNEKHRPPYRLKRVRLTRICEEACKHKFALIVQECYVELIDSFLSSNSNFWWEPVWQESYGAVIVSIVAHMYHFVDGRCLFISNKTRSKIPDSKLINKDGTKAKLDFVVNFEQFTETHTGANIGKWLDKSHKEAAVKHSYVGHHCVDGASNAWSSVEEFEWITRSERSTKIKATKCPPHQNNRSSKMASGTADLKVNANPLLGSILKKSHLIQSRINTSGTRSRVV